MTTSLRIDDKCRPGGDGTEVDDAEAGMSDYRLVVKAEDGGGDALFSINVRRVSNCVSEFYSLAIVQFVLSLAQYDRGSALTSQNAQ
eukprot:scaffold6730_cov66-Cyclotella_meneghiniana.AAC.3